MTDALDKLAELSQEMEKSRKIYEHDNDTWWNGLTEQEREDAFYAVCKRIWQADGIDNGSYRWALYDVFGFDPGMYMRGMDCGYMAIHNAIFDGEELQRMKSVTRLEVIDETGRAYVRYLKEDERLQYQLQDDSQTLKIFVGAHNWGFDPAEEPVQDYREETEVEFTDEELLKYMKLAHEMDITFNQFVEQVLRKYLDEDDDLI